MNNLQQRECFFPHFMKGFPVKSILNATLSCQTTVSFQNHHNLYILLFTETTRSYHKTSYDYISTMQSFKSYFVDCWFSLLGYNDILVLPAGAMNINITEVKPSNNFLGK